jgi:hypothetical protein
MSANHAKGGGDKEFLEARPLWVGGWEEKQPLKAALILPLIKDFSFPAFINFNFLTLSHHN